jgi:hypothetical protein
VHGFATNICWCHGLEKKRLTETSNPSQLRLGKT